MNGYTKSELALSIACCSITLLWAVVRFLVDFIGDANTGAFLSEKTEERYGRKQTAFR